MRYRAVIRIVGLLIALFSTTLLVPVVVSIIYHDGGGVDFFTSFVTGTIIGLLLWYPNRNYQGDLRVKEGFLIVVLFWTSLGAVGALPFLFTNQPQLTISQAFFEAFSALTTTGATVITGLDELPKAILFYRQMLVWLGGMGIIVLAVAVLPFLGVGGMQLYRAETPGPVKDSKMTPRIAETAKALWYIYLILTMSCTFSFWLAGMTFFDALGHAFSTVAIGGFSTHDESLGYFDSTAINMITTVFLLISGMNFAVHFAAFSSVTGAKKTDLGVYLRDPEIRAYFVLHAVLFAICFWVLIDQNVYGSVEETFDQAIFHTVSYATTGGFGADDIESWPLFLPVMLVLSSFIGGCAGSTGGGIKVIRVLLLHLQGVRELKRLIHPRAIYPIKITGQTLSPQVIDAVWGFFSAYTLIFLIAMLALMGCGLDQVSAFSSVAAMLNNLGPGLGEVGDHYADIGAMAQWIMIIMMLFGRLEIFTLLVLFTPTFWKN